MRDGYYELYLQEASSRKAAESRADDAVRQWHKWRDKYVALGVNYASRHDKCNIENPDLVKISFGSKIYFLIDGDIVVYAGQTKQPWPSRIAGHLRSDKVFTHAMAFSCPAEILDRIEIAMIYAVRPRYNSETSESPYSLSFNDCRATLDSMLACFWDGSSGCQ